MKRLAPLCMAFVLGAFLSACGAENTARGTLSSTIAAQSVEALAMPAADLLLPPPGCIEIHARLKLHRAALQLTPEWQSLTKTDAWSRLEADADKARENDCHHGDDKPSDACKEVIKAFKEDFKALQQTHQYKAAEQTAEWKTLEGDYKAAKELNCFEH